MTTAKNAALLTLTDAVALALVFALPALSHLTSVPFYLADPMRLAVLGALIATRNWKNSLALALALPLVSFALSGHPVYPKCLIIAAELAVNVALFAAFARAIKRKSALACGGAAFLSILLSKAFYYGLKALVLAAGLPGTELVSTALWIQLFVAVILSAGIALRFRK
ncbi:MAG: hypothetical protein J5771_01070 [Bacteroidales bacterium]|nr:hypothetical protein [Bacteroidales bacterium]